MSSVSSDSKFCTLDPQTISAQLHDGTQSNTQDEIKNAQIYVTDWNRDVEMAHHALRENYAKSIKHLLPDNVTRESLPPAVGTLLDRYALADTLALHMQSQLHRVTWAVLLMACLGLICFELTHWFSHLESFQQNTLLGALQHNPLTIQNEWPGKAAKITIIVFVVAWFMAICLGWKAHYDRVQERYQDYRALAEGLRVQFYWNLAGLKENASVAYPKRQREDLLWLRYALSQWHPKDQASSTDPKTVLNAWINNQHDYFLGSDGKGGEVAQNRQRNNQFRNVGRILLYTSIILGIVAAFMMLSEQHYVSSFLILIAGLGIVFAATCYACRERFAYAEHVKNYSAMAKIYQDAMSRLKEGKDKPELILVDLGHEALSESTEWLMLHRERHATEPHL